MLRTLNGVHGSWAKKISEDGLAGMNFSEPCHHVVRFVDRTVLIEPVESFKCLWSSCETPWKPVWEISMRYSAITRVSVETLQERKRTL